MTARGRRVCGSAGHAVGAPWLHPIAARQNLGRAGQFAGDRGFRLTALASEAQVTTSDTSLMGLRYPAEASCFLPPRAAGDAPPADAALWWADQAVRTAVAAAATHAAAVRAAETVSREAALTRRLLRALEHRRIPALHDALRLARTQVEQAEAADALGRRPAPRLSPGTDGPPRR